MAKKKRKATTQSDPQLFDADGKEVELVRQTLEEKAQMLAANRGKVGDKDVDVYSEIMYWLKEDYERSALSVTELCGRYGVSREVIQRLARNLEWKREPKRRDDDNFRSGGVMVPEGVELDLEQYAVIESLELIDKLIGGYGHLIEHWSRKCKEVRAGVKVCVDTPQGAVVKPVSISPYDYGHKDMKDLVKSVLDLSHGRLKLMERLPQAKGAEDIETQVANFAKKIQMREITTFQRDAMPDVVYVERTRAALEEIASRRGNEEIKNAMTGTSKQLRDIEDEIDGGNIEGQVV